MYTMQKRIVISTSHLLNEFQVSEHILNATTVYSVNRFVKNLKTHYGKHFPIHITSK